MGDQELQTDLLITHNKTVLKIVLGTSRVQHGVHGAKSGTLYGHGYVDMSRGCSCRMDSLRQNQPMVKSAVELFPGLVPARICRIWHL